MKKSLSLLCACPDYILQYGGECSYTLLSAFFFPIMYRGLGLAVRALRDVSVSLSTQALQSYFCFVQIILCNWIYKHISLWRGAVGWGGLQFFVFIRFIRSTTLQKQYKTVPCPPNFLVVCVRIVILHALFAILIQL